MKAINNFPFEDLAVRRIGAYDGNPTIVFLHDSLGSIKLWKDFPAQLGKMTQCNVLIYDRQGYGESCAFSYPKRDNEYMEMEANLLNELLNYWKIDEAILFGHSDGGSIALITAAKYAEKIKGIITEGAHIFVEEITLQGIRKAVENYQKTNLKSKLEKYHGHKTDQMFWAWADTWLNKDFKAWNIENFLGSIHCPILIIQGRDDEFGTLNQVEGIDSQSRGRSEKFIVPDAKHTPHKEKAETVLKRSADFIKTLIS